nr:unnamed protein product [Spirometra erinaceieuropaei]
MLSPLPALCSQQGEYRVDHQAPKTFVNSLMYKMSYYRFGELKLDPRMPSGYDRTRNVEIGQKNIDLRYLEEAFTSEHWGPAQRSPPKPCPQLTPAVAVKFLTLLPNPPCLEFIVPAGQSTLEAFSSSRCPRGSISSPPNYFQPHRPPPPSVPQTDASPTSLRRLV